MSRKLKFVLALLLASGAAFSVNACSVLTPVISPRQSSPAPQAGLETIEQAWNVIMDEYVDQSRIDVSKLSGAAIEAMVAALDDPYTAYLDPETYELNLSSMQGSFEGIGATVGAEEKIIRIIAPMPDSPAERAGIKAGDIILEIDGRSTEDMSLTEAVIYVRGPRGTTVRLLVQHEGETDSQEISVVRQKIEVPSIRYEMKEDIAYINIVHFSETTDAELIPVLAGLDRAAAAGIILDLRDNPGGFLQTVLDVAGHFLKKGDVVADVVDNKGNHSTSKAGDADVTTDLPVVILVNKYSASGSEVLAGAFQDYKRAVVAGTQTFGKGSVNILRHFKDGSGMYITTARWLTPQGHLIEGEGIEPDYPLDLEGEDAVNWAIDYLHNQEHGQGKI
ncbi:MAG: S41 family peptidase [Chloroflexota bacterium]